MSLPKYPGRRLSLPALLFLGIGCLLCTSGLVRCQQKVILGAPEMCPDSKPSILPGPGDPVKIETPADQVELLPPVVISPPVEGQQPLPRLLELPILEDEKKTDTVFQQVVAAEEGIDLVVGVPRRLVFREQVERVQMGGHDGRSVPATYEIDNEREVTLLAQRAGQAVMNVWFADANAPSGYQVVSFLLRILPDDRWSKDLEAKLRTAFPNGNIELKIVGQSLLVLGQAHDGQEAAQIMSIVTPIAELSGRNRKLQSVSAHSSQFPEAAGPPSTPYTRGQPAADTVRTAGEAQRCGRRNLLLPDGEAVSLAAQAAQRRTGADHHVFASAPDPDPVPVSSRRQSGLHARTDAGCIRQRSARQLASPMRLPALSGRHGPLFSSQGNLCRPGHTCARGG